MYAPEIQMINVPIPSELGFKFVPNPLAEGLIKAIGNIPLFAQFGRRLVDKDEVENDGKIVIQPSYMGRLVDMLHFPEAINSNGNPISAVEGKGLLSGRHADIISRHGYDPTGLFGEKDAQKSVDAANLLNQGHEYPLAPFHIGYYKYPDDPDIFIKWYLSKLKRYCREPMKSLFTHAFDLVIRTNEDFPVVLLRARSQIPNLRLADPRILMSHFCYIDPKSLPRRKINKYMGRVKESFFQGLKSSGIENITIESVLSLLKERYWEVNNRLEKGRKCLLDFPLRDIDPLTLQVIDLENVGICPIDRNRIPRELTPGNIEWLFQ